MRAFDWLLLMIFATMLVIAAALAAPLTSPVIDPPKFELRAQ